MMPPILILVLAWTLKGMTDALGIGDFVRQAVSLNEGLMRFVPLLIFCIAIFMRSPPAPAGARLRFWSPSSSICSPRRTPP